MAEVTVCIPAYRAAAFIHHTLASVRDQTVRDFEVEIAVEPVDAGSTLAACAPFLADGRFRAVVNPEVLDYAGNVRALLRRVRTPLFAVLPHDDVWHPRYLERLLASLRARPDASCAYSDVLCFAPPGQDTGVISQMVDDGDLPERLWSWFLDGASGVPWRGLTRSSVLDRDFPTNAFRGFAVECEWVLHLIRRGAVLRCAEPLYLKRVPATSDSVSASWFFAEDDLPAALDHHRERLLAGIPSRLSPADRDAITMAAEAAMLRRWQEFSNYRWGLPPRHLQRAADLLLAADRLEPSIAARVTATVRWALSRHWHAVGDLEAAEQEARKGLMARPDDGLLCTQLGWLLNGREAVREAVEVGLRASRAHPDDPGVRALLRHCEARLEESLRALSSPGEDEGPHGAARVTDRFATQAVPVAGASPTSALHRVIPPDADEGSR